MLPQLSALYPVKAAVVFAAVVFIAARGRRTHHPFARFGAANAVTAVRALLVALVAAAIGEAHTPSLAIAVVVVASITTVLDGLDGWLARRSRMTSAFGARFDVEVDALLIQVLAILAWRHGKAGAWVLAAGLLRYAFVASARRWPWMAAPLAPTRRARAICVMQIAGLVAILAPNVRPPISSAIAAATLTVLAWSFAVDIGRLWYLHAGSAEPPWRRWRARRTRRSHAPSSLEGADSGFPGAPPARPESV